MYKWARLGVASRNRALSRTLLFLFTIPFCRAVLVNRTIDSNKGDPVTGFQPVYQPQSPWADQTCSGCYIQPDIQKAFDGTWMAATYHPELRNVNITLQFTGVAVWIFFILSNANDHGTGTTTNTQVNITLDGQYAGNYSHDPDLSTHDLIYNATIFSASGLPNTSHQIVIATNDYPLSTFLNFDWAMYSIDDGTPASQSISSSTAPLTTSSFSTDSTSSSTSAPTAQNSSPKTGVIVGGAVGGLAVIALVFLLFLFRHRLRRAPPIQNQGGKTEGILDIDVPPSKSQYGKSQIHWRNPSAPSASEYTYFPPSSSSTWSPVPSHSPEQTYATRLREVRQRELEERIQSAQREMDNLKSVRNIRSANEIGSSSPAGSSRRSIPELTLMRNELQQLRDQIGHLQAQRQSDWAQGLSNDPHPPAYTRQ